MEKFWGFPTDRGSLGATHASRRSQRARSAAGTCHHAGVDAACERRGGATSNGHARPVIWTFGHYVLDTDLYELRAGDDSIPLGNPKPSTCWPSSSPTTTGS